MTWSLIQFLYALLVDYSVHQLDAGQIHRENPLEVKLVVVAQLRRVLLPSFFSTVP
jgi:hypothetical protein